MAYVGHQKGPDKFYRADIRCTRLQMLLRIRLSGLAKTWLPDEFIVMYQPKTNYVRTSLDDGQFLNSIVATTCIS